MIWTAQAGILLLGLGIGQFAFSQFRAVDLDAPGALQALERDKPAHYRAVREIVAGVHQQAAADVPRWIQARFQARDVAYGPMLLVTDPPKRRLAFTIDDVRYNKIVTLTGWTREIRPERDLAPHKLR